MGLGVCCFVVFRFGVYFLFAILVIGLLFIVLQLLVNWRGFLCVVRIGVFMCWCLLSVVNLLVCAWNLLWVCC